MAAFHRVYLSEIPLLFPLLAFGCGIAVGIGLSSQWIWWLVIGLALVVFIAFGLRRFAVGIYSFVAIIGMISGKVALPIQLSNPSEVTLIGEIREAKEYGDSYRLVVKSDVAGQNYLVWVTDADEELLSGDKIEVAGVAVPPQIYGTVPDEITNRQFVMTRKIYAEIAEPHGFKLLEESHGIRRWPDKVRRWLSYHLEHCGLTQASEQFLKAILIGDVNIEQDTRDDFSRSGLSHILAISGAHVGIIAMLIAILFFPLTMMGKSRTGMIATILVLWLYAVVTGCSPSVLRAVIMISFVVAGKLLGRNSNPLNSLCAAALLILSVSPLTLLNVGFLLSFLAVAGILLLMPILLIPFYKLKCRGSKQIRTFASLCCLPIAATIATAPLAIFHFHLFPVWFLLSNLLIAIVLPLILIGGACLLLFNLLGIGVGWIAEMLNWLIEGATAVGHVVSLHQPEEMSGIYLSGLVVITIYITLIALWLFWNNRRRVYIYAAMIGIVGISVAALLLPMQCPDVETFEWTTRHSFNVVHREGNSLFILTDASEKYRPALEQAAQFKLKDYMGKRGASFMGTLPDGAKLKEVTVEKDRWIVGGRRYLILRESNFPDNHSQVATAKDFYPDVIVFSRGFKGDASLIRRKWPKARIVLSPSLYPPDRKAFGDQLRDSSDSPSRK